MITRYIEIHGKYYCVYCGKELKLKDLRITPPDYLNKRDKNRSEYQKRREKFLRYINSQSKNSE